ncbi:zinc finger protein 93-like [Danaus plexippus]|uniref:zinc finger protein 93-like n=1 Tax=Danaus plexippus TaxID=13037 RepID=UPI002AAF2084|nr:zinc finger protein 93-like [Danaus plexippus]XP_032523914.2 zinc finger protein 93-like [Danaus plexippus]
MKRFNMDSFTNLCRSCLSPETGVSLCDNEDNIKEKFFEVTTVEVKEDDGLPQKLCNDCFTLMTSAYQFRNQCMKMDKELRLQLEAYINESAEQFSQIETQLKASEDMTIEDIAKESMKQLESIIKSEPNDSDDDYYYVVVVDNNKDDESDKSNSNSAVTQSIKKESTTEDIIMKTSDPSTQFENCIDSFLVTNPKVPNNVPATILENEEQEIDENFTSVDELSQDHSLGITEDSQDKSDDYTVAVPQNMKNNIGNSKSYIKILTPSGAERTILVKNEDGVKYLTDAQLLKDGTDSLSQEEVIFYEGDDASQLQILKCDGSELVIEYADDSQIATVLQQEDGTFLCDCGEQFDDFAEYEKHQYKHNPAGEHLCNLCGKGFETAEVLTGHMLLHSVTSVYVTCPFCCQKVRRNSLTQHIKYVHNTKPQCDICSKTFANQNNLKRHLMIHSGIKDFECDICHKRFHQKITMQTHRLTHVNPFTCNQCGLQFSEKADLTAHKSSEECSKTRITKVKEELMKTVKQEVVSNLGKLLGYACSLCKKMFTLESALEQHVETTHIFENEEQHLEKVPKKSNKKFDCRICGKSCASQAMMIMHERVHTNERPFPCQLCALRFKTKTHLRTHQLTHTREKKFGCSVCLKFFALKGNLVVHLRTHTGERPYVCSICGEAYIDSKYLKKHKQKKHAIDNVPWNTY